MTQKPADTTPTEIVTNEIVEHDGGWSFKVADAFAQAYSSRKAAVAAAERAAHEQRVPADPTDIGYADENGVRRIEYVGPGEAPETDVEA